MVKNTKNTGRNIIPIKHDWDNQPGLSDKCRNVNAFSNIYIVSYDMGLYRKNYRMTLKCFLQFFEPA